MKDPDIVDGGYSFSGSTQQGKRKVHSLAQRAGSPPLAGSSVDSCSDTSVKAAYGKTVRVVWAADGGQPCGAPPPTRRPIGCDEPAEFLRGFDFRHERPGRVRHHSPRREVEPVIVEVASNPFGQCRRVRHV